MASERPIEGMPGLKQGRDACDPPYHETLQVAPASDLQAAQSRAEEAERERDEWRDTAQTALREIKGLRARAESSQVDASAEPSTIPPGTCLQQGIQEKLEAVGRWLASHEQPIPVAHAHRVSADIEAALNLLRSKVGRDDG